jgi:hypothetical protein
VYTKREELKPLLSKHILNVQVSIRSPCC